jgi:transcription termination factor NusB
LLRSYAPKKSERSAPNADNGTKIKTANAHHSTRARKTHFAALFQIKMTTAKKIQQVTIAHHDFIEEPSSAGLETFINYLSKDKDEPILHVRRSGQAFVCGG